MIAKINDGGGNFCWFKGYNEKYLIDLGSAFASMSAKYSNLWIIQYMLRHRSVVSGMAMKRCFL